MLNEIINYFFYRCDNCGKLKLKVLGKHGVNVEKSFYYGFIVEREFFCKKCLKKNSWRIGE